MSSAEIHWRRGVLDPGVVTFVSRRRDMAKFGKLWIGIYAACCSALPFACSFTSMLPRVALE